ncbi:MAG: DUF962 domain-containing protein [Bacteriovoracaceae bacterium]
MRNFDQWMSEYGVSHQHPTNQLIHKFCVPLIMLTVIGFLKLIPTPEFFQIIPHLNWATLFVVSCLIFYLTLNLVMFLGMTVLTTVMYTINVKLEVMGILLPFSIIVFVISWVGQFYGHKIEGKKPSFLQDLAFLLIGPLWVLRFILKK